ncbi:hypothetical protein ACFPVT_03975 [Corynebacterium choanae]|uniref:Uncharacterized protein n=1 Tax=Corynebacterium choanae TaxID=1862358 RepID=A0A3G6J8M7_9CORY|nr:hypothetical protein [Corynebacterium choanae]AZA14346.1 hypothetical protein CCHOA_09815 [Corynebacterium choanae]
MRNLIIASITVFFILGLVIAIAAITGHLRSFPPSSSKPGEPHMFALFEDDSDAGSSTKPAPDPKDIPPIDTLQPLTSTILSPQVTATTATYSAMQPASGQQATLVEPIGIESAEHLRQLASPIGAVKFYIDGVAEFHSAVSHCVRVTDDQVDSGAIEPEPITMISQLMMDQLGKDKSTDGCYASYENNRLTVVVGNGRLPRYTAVQLEFNRSLKKGSLSPYVETFGLLFTSEKQ